MLTYVQAHCIMSASTLSRGKYFMARENVKILTTNVDPDDRDRITRHAKSKGYKSVAEYLRTLIEQDMDKKLSEVRWGREKITPHKKQTA